MLNKSVLGKIFSLKAEQVSGSSNDNHKNSELVYFTPSQHVQLEALIRPYKDAGLINCIEYGQGREGGFFLAKDGSNSREDVVLCVSIQKRATDVVPVYRVHGRGPHVTSSINFHEAVIDARVNLAKLTSDGRAPQLRLSLV